MEEGGGNLQTGLRSLVSKSAYLDGLRSLCQFVNCNVINMSIAHERNPISPARLRGTHYKPAKKTVKTTLKRDLMAYIFVFLFVFVFF